MSEPNTHTLANSLAERMRLDIIAAGLEEGDVYMTEADVARRYGVSRNIAREAVSQLRALGALKSRQGKGLLVSRSDPVALLARSLPFYGREPQDLKHLAQWRYVLEIGAVELAVAAATDEQIDRLETLARRYEELGSVRMDPPEDEAETEAREKAENSVELAFHGLVLEMTGNPLVAGMHDLLAAYFAVINRHPQRRSRKTSESARNRNRTIWQHYAIAEAFRQHDPEQVRVILRQHLLQIPYVQEALGGS